eukprot:jgi/Mesen1/8427/ME000472S07781
MEGGGVQGVCGPVCADGTATCRAGGCQAGRDADDRHGHAGGRQAAVHALPQAGPVRSCAAEVWDAGAARDRREQPPVEPRHEPPGGRRRRLSPLCCKGAPPSPPCACLSCLRLFASSFACLRTRVLPLLLCSLG